MSALLSRFCQKVAGPAHPPVGRKKNLVAAAHGPKTFEHGRIGVEALVGPVVAFLKLLNRHSFGPKNHMVHIIEVPVAGENPVFPRILFVEASSGVRSQDGEDSCVDLGLFAKIHHLTKNRRVIFV